MLRVKLRSSSRNVKNFLQIIENQYDSRNKTKFKSRTVCTVKYGIETTSFVAPRILSCIQRKRKECISVNEFQAKNKFWYTENCEWKILKMCIYQIGYIGYITCHLLQDRLRLSLFRYSIYVYILHIHTYLFCLFPYIFKQYI